MKIMVVDDSVVFRSSISSALKLTAGIEVFKTVANGKLAVDALINYPDIDLITLDMEMPVMDGLTAIKEIRKFNKKVIIIVFSSLTLKGAEKTIDALNSGANEFVTKPDITNSTVDDFDSIKNDLIPKVLQFLPKTNTSSIDHVVEEKLIPKTMLRTSGQVDVIAIGCSTGGPEVLSKIFSNLSRPINSSILIVQHMPPIFTSKLAEMLNKISAINVVEAVDGMEILPNTCYLAPGDYHMTVEKNIIKLSQSEKVCYVRPSADVLFKSLLNLSSKKIAVIILTGMGEDGANGAMNLNKLGSEVFIQDKGSSVVWGMPGAALKLIPQSQIVELSDFSHLIYKLSK